MYGQPSIVRIIITVDLSLAALNIKNYSWVSDIPSKVEWANFFGRHLILESDKLLGRP